MSESEGMKPVERILVRCKDPGDGSGDLMIEIPQVVLDTMSVNIGDELTVEKVGDEIALKCVLNSDLEP